jgi:hypothetical protein
MAMVIVSPRLTLSEIMAVPEAPAADINTGSWAIARPVGSAMVSNRARRDATLTPGLLMDI